MKFVWPNLSRQELEHLRRYSIDNWGAAVSRRYLEDIRDAAKAAAERPERARFLRDDFRILRARSHDLILHVDQMRRRVAIARVLHVAMEIERYLPQE